MQAFKKTNSFTMLMSLGVLSLSACAPDLHSFEMHMPSFFSSDKSFAAKKETPWPTDKWWAAYNDEQLNGLIEEGLQNSPTLAEAASRIRLSQAQTEQVQSPLLPSVELNGAVDKYKQSYYNGVPPDFIPKGYQNIGRATADLNWQLDFWGKTRNALDAAISEEKAAQLDAAQATITLSTQIAEEYSNLFALYADLDAAQTALNVRGQNAKLYKDRMSQGLESEGTYDQQLSEQAAVQADIESLNEQIALAKNGIALLLGEGPDRALTIRRPKAKQIKSFALPKNIPADLMGRRPDIQAAKYRALAAAKVIKVAKADFYPNISLTGYWGHQSLGLEYFTKQGASIGEFGPALSLPIFDAGLRVGRYKQAGAEYDLSVAQYNDTVLHALNDIANAATSQRMLKIRTQRLQEAVNASEKAYGAALNRYKGGLSTYLDVLRVEDSLIINRRALADIKSRAFTLDIQMIRALGGGFNSPDYK